MGKDYLAVKVEASHAEDICRNLYGIEGKMTPQAGEIWFNFRLESASGLHLLKISRPDESQELIQLQLAALNHLSQGIPHIKSPQVVQDLKGKQISGFKDEKDQSRIAVLLTWIEGRVWSSVNPINDSLLQSLGIQAGNLSKAFRGFEHPAAERYFEWDLAQADWTIKYLHLFSEDQRSIISYFQNQYKSFQDTYRNLRKGFVHNDANDNNIIVTEDLEKPEVKAIIDFGDTIRTQNINDVAVTIAYAVMDKPDVLSAALPVLKGYHGQFPILEEELKYLYNLVAMRLVISVTKSALNRKEEPDNEYLLISESAAWDVLSKWKQKGEDFAHYSFRNACGFIGHPDEEKFRDWSKEHPLELSALIPSIGKELIHHLDLSVSSPWTGNYTELSDLDHFQYKIERLQAEFPEKIIAGGYLEPRSLYTSGAYDKLGNNGKQSRSIHLGIDFWVPVGTPVHALFNGEIHTAVNDKGDKEYGGLIILRHCEDDVEFFTLHGHLSIESVKKIKPGQFVEKGECIGFIGKPPDNGNWAPHLHFQIMLSPLNYVNDFPGVAYPEELEVWKSICPDPNLIFQKKGLLKDPSPDLSETMAFRKKHLGISLSLSYSEPLKIVRGEGAFLIDYLGRKYLDTVNNVAHVGHEHPRVVKAGQQQMAMLNTNTRYLHDNINLFAEELLSTFPEELSVVHFVNSGSEANELALRMAYASTGAKDMIAVEVGYHGNSNGCINISSYKFDGKGGTGAPEQTHIVPLPDQYRGLYRGKDSGPDYAGHVRKKVEHIRSQGRNVAGFICESLISCGGQIDLPDNYLEIVYEEVRSTGGICIADEVQVGCGRVGEAFWGFQLHRVIPDIVTIGKPIGNGHPLAAVVCTRTVAEAFANGMEYFNTFGGNPVSCIIGKEVLQVIRDESLQDNALRVGNYLKSEFGKMQKGSEIIGDIRGLGLFLGIEMADKDRNPLTEKASYLANRMKELGILMSTDGKDNNVLKIKPPMVFSKDNADELLSAFRTIIKEDFMIG